MAKAKKKVAVKRKSGAKNVQGLSTSWHPIEALRREIDRLFENFNGGFFSSPAERGTRDLDLFRGFDSVLSSPAMDIAEKKGSYEISAELPGMDENNIELNISDGILTIAGEKTNERKEEEEDYYIQERHYGSFRRSVRVPDDVNIDKIDARFQKGVLKITLPRKPGATKPTKKIDVKAA